ncbi:hypothetical protein BTVI_64471 [Pitangus sulphuratus]|nr:hypothetical protein BTVI_64471 [Pitangus sulphuratus]
MPNLLYLGVKGDDGNVKRSIQSVELDILSSDFQLAAVQNNAMPRLSVLKICGDQNCNNIQDCLSDQTSYVVEYAFGPHGSAVLAMSPPKILSTSSQLVRMECWIDSADAVQALLTSSRNTVLTGDWEKTSTDVIAQELKTRSTTNRQKKLRCWTEKEWFHV